MRFWFDTEFYENGRTIELISIGVVSEDGRTYYAETPDGSILASKSDWLIKHVLPHLCASSLQGRPREYISSDLIAFMGEKPEIWAYYADYDWVALCQLHGRMIDLPKGWPMYCRDVKQLCDALGNPRLPRQTSTEHHALADAKWTREAWLFLNGLLFVEGDYPPLDKGGDWSYGSPPREHSVLLPVMRVSRSGVRSLDGGAPCLTATFCPFKNLSDRSRLALWRLP